MADTLRDDLLPLIDELRGLPGELGFRQNQVYVRCTSWTGDRPGKGVKQVTETRLLVGNGQDPKVREVHRKDVAAGTKELVDGEWDIGPLTPEYAGGGVSESLINPQKSSDPAEFYFVLKGPGMPDEGLLCQRVGDHVDRALRILVRVRSIGRKA